MPCEVVSAAMQGQHPETQNTGFASVVCLIPGGFGDVVKTYGFKGRQETCRGDFWFVDKVLRLGCHYHLMTLANFNSLKLSQS